MKQLLLMIVLTAAGTLGAFFNGPFWGLAVYYLFAVLRPQFLWKWVLPPNVQWSMMVAVATLAATGLHSLGFYRDPGESDLPIRRFALGHLMLAGFAVWILLSFSFALNQKQALTIVIDYSKIITMMVVSAIIIRRTWQVWTLALVAVLSLSYIAYEVNFMYAFQNYLGIYHNGYGGLDNNGAGLMLAMAIPFCIFLWESNRRWWRWFFAAMIPVLLHAVLMTYSRGAMVALLFVAPLIFLRSGRKSMMTLVFVAVALILPILAGPEIRERFFSVQKFQEDRSAQSRFGSWRAGIAIALDYPVFGAGPRNAPLITYRYGADVKGRVIHSQYVQIAADYGFIGLGWYLGMMGCSLFSVRRVRRVVLRDQTPEGRRIYGLACGIECSLVVFAAGALFLSIEVFELPYLLMILAMQLPLVLTGELSAETAPAPLQPAFRPVMSPGLAPMPQASRAFRTNPFD